MMCAGAAMLSVIAAISFTPAARDSHPAPFPELLPNASAPIVSSRAVRAFALQHAHVWEPIDSRSIDLASNPPDPGGLLSQPLVPCRFVPRPARGTTPKFDCELTDGEIVKVKYGATGEVPAEVAATRLLTALGFGADRMYLVPLLRCYGCARTPFYLMWAANRLAAYDAIATRLSADRFTDFQWVAVERRYPGVEVRDDQHDGWAWYELDANRASPRDQLDALRLAAMFLAHWDNKSANQRLLCGEVADSRGAGAGTRGDLVPHGEGGVDAGADGCERPFAIIHDLGATFGPNKVDREAWSASPIWSDRSRCTVSMRTFPYDGSTFSDAQISEAGRRLLLGQLAGLDHARVEAMFQSARFNQPDAWARTLMSKIDLIAAAGPCPDAR